MVVKRFYVREHAQNNFPSFNLWSVSFFGRGVSGVREKRGSCRGNQLVDYETPESPRPKKYKHLLVLHQDSSKHVCSLIGWVGLVPVGVRVGAFIFVFVYVHCSFKGDRMILLCGKNEVEFFIFVNSYIIVGDTKTVCYC